MRTLIYILFFLLFNSCAYSQKQESQQTTFCVTKTGKKYHRCECQYVNSSSFTINEEAILKRGLTACSVCRPGEIHGQPDSTASPNHRPQGLYTPQHPPGSTQKNATLQRNSQCVAKTKAGLRCKRTASKGSDRCWQHQN